MAREKLPNELIESEDDPDAYHKTTVYRNADGTHTAHIPGTGKVQVEKELSAWPVQHESFAWKIKK